MQKYFFKGMNEIGAYQGKVRGSIGCEPPTEEILEKFLYYFQVSLYLNSLRDTGKRLKDFHCRTWTLCPITG